MAQIRGSPSLTKFSPSGGSLKTSTSTTTETALANFRSRLDADANHAGIRTLQRQMDILRGELEREQNLRRTERQRHDQVVSRLRQQMEFSLEEVKDYKTMMEEQQESAKLDREKMEGEVKKTIDLLKELEDENRQMLKERNERERSDQQLRMMKESKAFDERRIESSRREIEQLRQALVVAEKRAIEAEQALSEQKNLAGCEEMVGTTTDDIKDEDDDGYDDEYNNYGVSPERRLMAQSIISKRQHNDRRPSTADEFIDVTYGISPDKKRQKRKSSSLSANKNCSTIKSPISSAPEAILTELNNTRLLLQDAERKNRTLTRQLESQKEKYQSLIQIEHELERCKEKLSVKETSYQKLVKEMSNVEALKEQWKACQDMLQQILPPPSHTTSFSSMSPPELSALARRVKLVKHQMDEAVKEKNDLELELQSLQRDVEHLDDDRSEKDKTISRLLNEKKEHDRAIQNLQSKLHLATAGESIAKREAASMRQIIETFETEEKQGGGKSIGFGQSPGREGLTASLRKAREDIEMFEEAATKAQDELDVLQKQCAEDKQKHETVLMKFGKLREALMAEREKAEIAETRAIKAETLVGKGMFNTDTTRALHLKQNPLLEATRERYEKQIATLKAQIEQQQSLVDGIASPPGVSAAAVSVVTKRPDGKCSCGFDEKKLNQRLKESFKEQIGIFREGVYLITGFKVDMTFAADCPQFKVRSLFAEHESDHLMFKWPLSEGGKGRATAPSSLDLMSSDFAEQCTKMEEFQYLSEYKSIPAFMSALALKLFESTTICH